MAQALPPITSVSFISPTLVDDMYILMLWDTITHPVYSPGLGRFISPPSFKGNPGPRMPLRETPQNDQEPIPCSSTAPIPQPSANTSGGASASSSAAAANGEWLLETIGVVTCLGCGKRYYFIPYIVYEGQNRYRQFLAGDNIQSVSAVTQEVPPGDLAATMQEDLPPLPSTARGIWRHICMRYNNIFRLERYQGK